MSVHVATMNEVFNDHPHLKRDDVEHVKDWLVKQKHLPPVSDQQVAVFLFSCCYSLELTKTCIDAYFTVKTGSPEFFRQRDPLCPGIQHISKVVQIVPLHATSPEGYRYILGRLRDVDPSQLHLNDAIKLLFMTIDAAMRQDVMTPGVVFIYDMKGVVFQHLTRVSIVSVKKYIAYLREAMPVKLKTLHIINVNSVINSIMAIFKPLMKPEEIDRLHFHSEKDPGMSQFFEAVPQKIMPKDYGGQSDSMEELLGETQKLLVSYRGWFQEGEQFTVDESKRVGATRSAGTIFGLDGSFKKLDID